MVNARKHDRLVEVKEVKLDGHCHVFSNPRPRANKWWRDPGSRKLVDLLSHVERAGINSIALTNAGDDWLYERFASQVRELPDGYGFYQDERVTQVLTSDGVPYTFLKAEELFTIEGHMLVWGTKFGQMYQPKAGLREFKEKVMREFHIDYALHEVEKDKLLTTISDHTNFNGGLVVRGFLYLRENRFDAYEFNALASRKANKVVIARAARDKKPVVYDSDAHRPRQIGRAYNVFNGNDLSWEDGIGLVASLKENIRKNNFTGVKGYVSSFGALHHVYMLVLDHKLGLYTKDVKKDDFDIERANRTRVGYDGSSTPDIY